MQTGFNYIAVFALHQEKSCYTKKLCKEKFLKITDP